MTGAPTPFGHESTSPPLLSMANIGKDFGSFTALDGIGLEFIPGKVHCLLGENGAGKSTLCNLVFGIHQPSRGKMTFNGADFLPLGPKEALSQGVSMVHQHFSLINELSTVDNLLLGRKFGRLDRKREAEQLTAFADTFGLKIDPFALVGELSIGQRQKIEIVKCLIHKPKMLILDEPTAVLLPEEIASLLEVCRSVAAQGSAVVMVTHKLLEIQAVADEVSVLRNGSIVARSGTPESDIDSLVAAMIGRGSDVGAGFGAQALPPRQPAPATAHAKPDALQLDGISYLDQLGAKRLDTVTLTIGAGEILGLAGVEGNGQSELGAILAGLQRPSEGRWFVCDNELTHAHPKQINSSGVGIVPEDRHLVGAISDLSLAENLFLGRMQALSKFGLLDRQRMKTEASSLIQQFDVRTQGPEACFGGLSGGNQQKAVLARELTTPGLQFLLAAHPTRGLDIGAIEAVYTVIRAAADAGVGVLLISSELDELMAVADRIAVIYRGQIAGQLAADVSHRSEIGALMSGKVAA